MGQHHSGRRLSLGSKLLLSAAALIAAVILFLGYFSIVLLKNDKRTYVLKTQATEAALIGHDLVGLFRHAIDVQKNIIALSGEANALENFAKNQTLFTGIKFGKFHRSGDGSPVTFEATFEHGEKIPDAAYASALADLGSNPFGFFGMMGESMTRVGVLLTDKWDASGTAPAALGILSAEEYEKELRTNSVSVTTKSGLLIFTSDSTYVQAPPKDGKFNLQDPLYLAALQNVASSGARDFELDDERYIGSFTKPGLDLLILSRTPWKRAMQASYVLIEKLIFLGLMAISAGVIFAIIFSKSLTAPLDRLYHGTKEVSRGKFDLNLEISTSDEIGELTESFNTMSTKINELIKDSVKKAHLESELAIASTVQQTLFPPEEIRTKHLLLRSYYESASECGGDWWGFFGVDSKLAIMIADATGHGIPSALITASARSCFSVMNKLAQEDPEFTFSPSAMLHYANRVVFDASMTRIMMTFFVGVIDFSTGKLTYANAAHNPPWVVTPGSTKFQSLISTGTRLGETKDGAEFPEKSVQLGENDILFLYTDGLVEGKDLKGEQFGKKRVKKLVEASATSGPEKLIKDLTTEFHRFNHGKPLDDDVTLAALQVLKIGNV